MKLFGYAFGPSRLRQKWWKRLLEQLLQEPGYGGR